MRVFAEFWTKHLKVGSALPRQLENTPNLIGSALPNQLPDNFANLFFSVGFTHHFSIASKCETLDEAWFYLQKTVTELWDYRLLETKIRANLFKQQGTLPNNFDATLPESHREKALQALKDEYLLDFINIEDPDEEDERVIENEIVRNIKKFKFTILYSSNTI